MPTARQLEQHRRVVAALTAHDGADPSRLLHHAVRADDVDTILRYGPVAAGEASLAGAHREAAAHCASVLRHASLLEPRKRASLLRQHARELYLLQRFDEAARQAQAAVKAWEQLDEPEALGDALSAVSWTLYWSVDPTAARNAAERAVALLEPLGPSAALARAYANQASLLMMADGREQAVEAGQRARSLAEQLGLTDVFVQAMSYEGAARVENGDDSGWELVDRSVELAPGLADHELAARALANATRVRLGRGRHAEARRYVEQFIALAHEHEFYAAEYRGTVYRAWLDVEDGRWDAAAGQLEVLQAQAGPPGPLNALAFALLGRLRVRRGEPGADLLDIAWDVARRTDEILLLGPSGAARVEAAWLAGDARRASAVAREPLQAAEQRGHVWFRGELLRYLGRAGVAVEAFDGCPQPWRLGIVGDWRGAAEAWGRLGNRYEHALELVCAPDPQPVLEGLAALDDLGAAPAARIARNRLRGLGVRTVPRGPQRATRANPANLTARQLEILALLRDGLTNAEIAERLVLSVRTVDHHVSAVLDKLGVDSRRQAARQASEIL